jgi:hypothetical protein
VSVRHDPDTNAWAGRADLADPTCARSPVQARDPLDGGPLAPFLERLAVRRGRAAVRADVIAWLTAPPTASPMAPDGWAAG